MNPNLTYVKTDRVNTAQADRWGRLRPSALLELLQETAGEHCYRLGVGRDNLDPRGLFWAVIRQTVEIRRMPRIGETVLAETWPGPASRVAYPRYILGRTPQGEELFRAVSLWLLMDQNTRAMVLPGSSGVEVPGLLRGGELSAPASIAPTPLPNRDARAVRYSELDCNGHLSNTRYLNWMEDLLPAVWHRAWELAKVHICYFNEAREDQEIALTWGLEEGALALEGRREAGEKPDRVFALRAIYRPEEGRP